jgi:serine/threonine-protein kinase
LKPSNILIDRSGTPFVTDFGLARRIGGAAGMTASGAVLGTPSYMAPEQASGRRDSLTAATDVYGLGAILFELLAGRPPFDADSAMETVLLVLEREPPSPSLYRSGIPHELANICLKCLEKSPDERYATPADLADDLDRFLRGDAVEGTTAGHRLRRWIRREPELAARLGGLGAVAALTQYNYMKSVEPSPWTHWTIIAVLSCWAVSSVTLQAALRRGCPTVPIRAVWSAMDVGLLTAALLALRGEYNTALVGYPLLIATSGLWFHTRLVWYTTAFTIAGYAALRLLATLPPDVAQHQQYSNIFVAALVLTGFVVFRQVTRMNALVSYYDPHRTDSVDPSGVQTRP